MGAPWAACEAGAKSRTPSAGACPQADTLEIREKRSDALVRRIELGTQGRGIDRVSAGDYDFQGVEDIAVFEATAAGAQRRARREALLPPR